MRRRILKEIFRGNLRDDVEVVDDEVARTGRDRQYVRIELYQCHLPMLEEQGFIRRDGCGNLVEGPVWDEIAPILETMVEYCGEQTDEQPVI